MENNRQMYPLQLMYNDASVKDENQPKNLNQSNKTNHKTQKKTLTLDSCKYSNIIQYKNVKKVLTSTKYHSFGQMSKH